MAGLSLLVVLRRPLLLPPRQPRLPLMLLACFLHGTNHRSEGASSSSQLNSQLCIKPPSTQTFTHSNIQAHRSNSQTCKGSNIQAPRSNTATDKHSSIQIFKHSDMNYFCHSPNIVARTVLLPYKRNRIRYHEYPHEYLSFKHSRVETSKHAITQTCNHSNIHTVLRSNIQTLKRSKT